MPLVQTLLLTHKTVRFLLYLHTLAEIAIVVLLDIKLHEQQTSSNRPLRHYRNHKIYVYIKKKMRQSYVLHWLGLGYLGQESPFLHQLFNFYKFKQSVAETIFVPYRYLFCISFLDIVAYSTPRAILKFSSKSGVCNLFS